MQTHRLTPHPAQAPVRAHSLAVRWGRVRDGRIMLRFRLDGCEDVVLPRRAPAQRTDDLWRSTCFELFLAGPNGTYREFNFSPSGQWAAYAFNGYRTAAGNFDPIQQPEIEVESGQSVLTVTVFLDGAELEGFRHASLTAVVEEKGGRLSYWAHRHARQKPDFHEPTCFVLPVP